MKSGPARRAFVGGGWGRGRGARGYRGLMSPPLKDILDPI